MSYKTVSPRLVETIIEIYPTSKFNDGDVIFDWMDSAIDYMNENVENNTANDFVLAMRQSYLLYNRLTKGQIRGLLNCIRGEVLAADKEANAVIEQVVTGKEPLDLRKVPSGSYAVSHGENSEGLGKVAFYVIDNIQTPSSKWNGWVFVNILASDSKIKVGSQRPGQTYQGQHENLLREIVKDPFKASALFGKLIGRCGICGRTLTDPESIEMGIGPICAKKSGWNVSEFEAAALRALGYTD